MMHETGTVALIDGSRTYDPTDAEGSGAFQVRLLSRAPLWAVQVPGDFRLYLDGGTVQGSAGDYVVDAPSGRRVISKEQFEDDYTRVNAKGHSDLDLTARDAGVPLEACRACGERPNSVFHNGINWEGWCTGCGARGPQRGTRKEAGEGWNLLMATPLPGDVRDLYQQAYDEIRYLEAATPSPNLNNLVAEALGMALLALRPVDPETSEPQPSAFDKVVAEALRAVRFLNARATRRQDANSTLLKCNFVAVIGDDRVSVRMGRVVAWDMEEVDDNWTFNAIIGAVTRALEDHRAAINDVLEGA